MYEYRQDFICSGCGFYLQVRFLKMYGSIPWQSQNIQHFVLGSIFVHVICPTDLLRKPSGHRSIFTCDDSKAVSPGVSRMHSQEHFSQCQQYSRLENLCRFCSDTNPRNEDIVCWGGFRARTRPCILRVGFYGYRFMLGSFPLGVLPQDQSSSETVYPFEFEEQYYSGCDKVGHFEPLGEGHIILRHNVSCALCGLIESPCPIKDHPCMTKIDVETVWRAILQMESCLLKKNYKGEKG